MGFDRTADRQGPVQSISQSMRLACEAYWPSVAPVQPELPAPAGARVPSARAQNVFARDGCLPKSRFPSPRQLPGSLRRFSAMINRRCSISSKSRGRLASFFIPPRTNQSTLAPEMRTTFAYFSMSRRTKAANSSGLLPTASAPSAANCDWISGERTTFTTASFRRAMMR